VHRGLTAEIDLGAAARNLEEIRKAASNLPVIAVVKADAYGHGAAELSRAYEKAGVHALAVAFVSEARTLRQAGISAPILVLFDNTEIGEFFSLGLTPVIHEVKTAEAISREAQRRNASLDIHIKVDTGMGRVGLDGVEDALRVASLPNLRTVGLMSHFSDADLADAAFMKDQIARFRSIRDALRAKGLRPLCHMANSAAVLASRDSHLDAVRPGLILYGTSPFDDERAGLPPLVPVMRVTARVLTVRKFAKGKPVSYARTFITRRETLAAVVAAGYADGYNRAFSNNADVLLNSRRAPVIGRVCMDLMVVDATDVGGVGEHDEAVLLGSQGGETVTAWELARRASTIPYEVFLWLGRGAKRTYTGAVN